jgi:pimeloyl-ACP methyl ester carboxylesterase
MKKINQSIIYLFIAFFATVSLNSCDTKKSDPEKPANEYLISSEVKSTITAQQALGIFTTLSPDAAVGLSFIIKSDVEVREMVYKTTYNKQTIQASGLVCLPKLPGNYPILSFQNGTNTEFNMAPSDTVNYDLYAIIESIASMGFIVTIPDYIGFGVSKQLPHPYLQAESTVQSILDLIRAAKELGADELETTKPTKDLFIFGYSQGGWATMEVQKKIETSYATEFNLKASSCGAGPYSIEYLNSTILSQTEYPTPYFLAYVLNSYIKTGEINKPLSDFFNEPYATRIPGLFDGTHSGGEINSQLTSVLPDLFTASYRTGFDANAIFAGVKSAFRANSIEAWNTVTPTRLYHGENDEVIPISMSQKMLADFKTKGVPDSKIELKRIPGADHTSGVYQTGLETILWFLQLK